MAAVPGPGTPEIKKKVMIEKRSYVCEKITILKQILQLPLSNWLLKLAIWGIPCLAGQNEKSSIFHILLNCLFMEVLMHSSSFCVNVFRKKLW